MKRRTIICLAAKRSGTTAIHQVFVEHPETGICHPDQRISNWEPNFWNYAAAALDNDRQGLDRISLEKRLTPQQQFAERMSIMAPGITVRLPLSEEIIFELWDQLLKKYGPIVFDKSPKYLGSRRSLQLLLKYIGRGNDVRVFGLIRNPRDVIASQWRLWHKVVPYATPEYRERRWTDYYQEFERFRDALGVDLCPLIRYEDFAHNPQHWISFILRHCGLEDIPRTYVHIRPVSIGRYLKTKDKALSSWKCSEELKSLAFRYGYDVDKKSIAFSITSFAREIGYGITRHIRWRVRYLVRCTWRLVKRILPRILAYLPTTELESLIYHLVAWRTTALPADEALRFLFRRDAALYPLQGQQAVKYDGGVHTKHRHMRYHDFFINRIFAGERVLDIGCGTGAVSYDVASKARARVLGIDLNPNNISQACKRYVHPRVEYRVGDVLKELPDEPFDVVILSNLMEHLPERSAFLDRVQKLARPSRFLIRVPLFERDWRVPLKQELGVEWRLDPTHETEYTLASLLKELAAAGLTVKHQEVRWGEIWTEAVPSVST